MKILKSRYESNKNDNKLLNVYEMGKVNYLMLILYKEQLNTASSRVGQ